MIGLEGGCHGMQGRAAEVQRMFHDIPTTWKAGGLTDVHGKFE